MESIFDKRYQDDWSCSKTRYKVGSSTLIFILFGQTKEIAFANLTIQKKKRWHAPCLQVVEWVYSVWLETIFQKKYKQYQRTQGQIIQTSGKNKFKIELIFKPNNKWMEQIAWGSH